MSQFYRLEQEFLEVVAGLKNWLIQPIALLGFHLYPQALLDNLEQAAGSVVDRIVGGANVPVLFVRAKRKKAEKESELWILYRNSY